MVFNGRGGRGMRGGCDLYFSAAIRPFIGVHFEKPVGRARGAPRFALDSSISLNDGSR